MTLQTFDLAPHRVEEARRQLPDLFDLSRTCCFAGIVGELCEDHADDAVHAPPDLSPVYRTLEAALELASQ